MKTQRLNFVGRSCVTAKPTWCLSYPSVASDHCFIRFDLPDAAVKPPEFLAPSPTTAGSQRDRLNKWFDTMLQMHGETWQYAIGHFAAAEQEKLYQAVELHHLGGILKT